MLQINLTGDESQRVLAALAAAMAAYNGAMSEPMAPGEPTTEGMVVPTDPEQPQVIENPSHSYTEGMTITADPEQVFAGSEEISEPANTGSPGGTDVQENGATPVELDSAGKPWDEKIHSSSREKTKDGCWKFKRGLDPALRNAAEAAVSAVNTMAQVAIPPHTVAPVIPPPPAQPAPAAEAHTLPWLMGVAAKAQKTKADIDAALAACGLRTIPDLLGQLDKMDDVARALGVL